MKATARKKKKSGWYGPRKEKKETSVSHEDRNWQGPLYMKNCLCPPHLHMHLITQTLSHVLVPQRL